MEKSTNVDISRVSNDRSASDLEEQKPVDAKPPAKEKPTREALLIVVGGFCSLFVSFGWINATGFFEAYYQHVLLTSYSPSTITWISSIGFAFLYLFSLPMGILIRRVGCKPVLLMGSILHVLGLLTMSFSTQYYQLVLSQGICSGLGSSAIFYAGVTTVSRWFATRQALAIGVSASGSSLGGIVFPVMVTELIPRIGFGWTVRAATLVVVVLLLIANLVVKDCPQPAPPVSAAKSSSPSNAATSGMKPPTLADIVVAAFKSKPFILTTIAGMLFSFGYFVTLILLVTVATIRGVPNPAYTLVILNAASFPGRIVPGALADKFGRYNTMCVMTFISAVLTLGLYLPTQTPGAFITYCVLFGFTSASMVFLSPTLVYQISKPHETGVRIGILYSLVSFSALFGAPIGGALLPEITKGLGPSSEFTQPGRWLILFCGLCQTLGCMVFIWTRWTVVGYKIVRI